MMRLLPGAHLGGMTPSDLAKFTGALEAAQARLEQSLRSRDGIALERTADPADEAQHAFDQELTSRALDRESSHLVAIKVALRRIAERTYGICECCDREIGLRRLAAVPWTRYCVRCQEVVECRDGRQTERSFDLDSAA